MGFLQWLPHLEYINEFKHVSNTTNTHQYHSKSEPFLVFKDTRRTNNLSWLLNVTRNTTDKISYSAIHNIGQCISLPSYILLTLSARISGMGKRPVTTVSFAIVDHYNVRVPRWKICLTIFFKLSQHITHSLKYLLCEIRENDIHSFPSNCFNA